MKQLHPKLTFANVVSCLALFVALGGSAFAATQLPKNAVGSKQLKKNAVTEAKIMNNAVTGAKIKNGAISSSKIDLGSLGTVPTATTAGSATTAGTAGTANSVTGRTPFFVRLGVGGVQTLATNGAVALVATCVQEGEYTIGRILEQTSANGAVADGSDDFNGGSSAATLSVSTPASDRVLVEESEKAGKTYVRSNQNGGFVLGPEGKMLSLSQGGVAMGINYITPGCLFGGVIDSEG